MNLGVMILLAQVDTNTFYGHDHDQQHTFPKATDLVVRIYIYSLLYYSIYHNIIVSGRMGFVLSMWAYEPSWTRTVDKKYIMK